MQTFYTLILKKNNKIFTFKLKANSKIITPGKLFETFNFKELNVLFEENIFRPEIYNAAKY